MTDDPPDKPPLPYRSEELGRPLTAAEQQENLDVMMTWGGFGAPVDSSSSPGWKVYERPYWWPPDFEAPNGG